LDGGSHRRKRIGRGEGIDSLLLMRAALRNAAHPTRGAMLCCESHRVLMGTQQARRNEAVNELARELLIEAP
jgi:hypothetical protein